MSIRIPNYRSILNRQHPLNRGLVSEWVVLPGLAGGTKFYDICSQNHGTLTNGPTWQSVVRPGGFGSLLCVGFGASQYISVNGTSFNSGSAMTVGCWVRPATVGNSTRAFVSNLPGAFNAGWGLDRLDDALRFIAHIDGNYRVSSVSSFLTAGTWYYITGTYDGTTIRLYSNGIEVANTVYSGTITTSAGNLTINTYPGGNDGTAYYDEVFFYNRVLSASEISARFQESSLGNPNRWNYLDVSQLSLGVSQLRELYYRYNMFSSPIVRGIRIVDEEENE